jgi:hypothetical protein
MISRRKAEVLLDGRHPRFRRQFIQFTTLAQVSYKHLVLSRELLMIVTPVATKLHLMYENPHRSRAGVLYNSS